MIEVLTAIVVLSFLVERALAVLFENRWFVEKFASRGIKEPISVLVAFAICRSWDFDAISIILTSDHTRAWGHLVTPGIIAGGSKASLKLFHDVLDIRSTADWGTRAEENGRHQGRWLALSGALTRVLAQPWARALRAS